jgi:outer membrane receptor for ferric coprogen and ferric-rhodotorulic acid
LTVRRSPSPAGVAAPIPAVALGDDSSAPRTLTEISVQAEAERTVATELTGAYLATAATIGKTEQSLKEIPQTVTVMTRQRIDDQNLRSLDEVLLNTPGITVEQSNSFDRAFYSRGFEIETIQYDGVPTRRGNGFLINPDLAGYDRVEVLRGPAGLFNGAGRPGGTVNLVRKRPLADPQFKAQISAGSWNYRRAEFDLSLPLNEAGSVRGRLVGAHEDREFFYDVSKSKRSLLYGIVEADLSSQTTLGIGVNHERNDMRPFYGGLPRFTDGRSLGLPRSSYLNAAWADTDIRTTSVFADLNHRFNDDWKLKVGVTHMREDNDDLSGSNFGAVNPVTSAGQTISSFSQRLEGRQTSVDGTLTGSFAALGRTHDVIIGGNYQRRAYANASQALTVPNAAFNPYTFNPWDYLTRPTLPSRAASNTMLRSEETGLYASLRFALTDRMKAIGGARGSWFKTSTFNNVAGTFSVRPYEENAEITPYGALTYDISPTWTVYGSYAEIFRSQANSFTAAGNPLTPATGSNVELGMKGTHLGGKVSTSFALFRIIEANRMQTDPFNPTPCLGSPTLGACYVAEGKVRSQGFDTEVTGELLPGWHVAAGYTFNQTTYLRDRTATGAPSANENQPSASFTPKHLLRAWTTYRLPGDLSAWTVGGGVNLQSMAYKTAGGVRWEQGGYAVWAARIGYRFNRNLSASVNLNNIFDKAYYRTIGGNLGGGNWYGDPRNVMATLTAVF